MVSRLRAGDRAALVDALGELNQVLIFFLPLTITAMDDVTLEMSFCYACLARPVVSSTSFIH